MFWARLSFLFFAVISLAGCAGLGGTKDFPIEPAGPYLLDSGDRVRITVFGQAELSREYSVDDAGDISMPLVGSVPARGSTTQQLGTRIKTELAAGYLRSPDVATEIAAYRPFFIQGAVASSGQYPYAYGMTVRNAISVAGGYGDAANKRSVMLYRPAREGSRITKGRVGLDFAIYPGDTIEVSELGL